MFGSTNGATIRNIGMVGGTITGLGSVGGLIGLSVNTTINNAYTTSNVTGSGAATGGLVGQFNAGSNINNAYATGNVSGNNTAGGLVGGIAVGATVSNSYATGNVYATYQIGGLSGTNEGVIYNSFATGSVTGSVGSTRIGGFSGANIGIITNSFWNNTANPVLTGIDFGTITGVTARTITEMKQMATFSGAGWDIANTGGSSAIWRIYEGSTTPLLRSFLKPLIIASNSTTTTYSIAGADTSGHLFGTGTGVYSDQQGYDVSFATLPAPVATAPAPAPAPAPVATAPETPVQPINLNDQTSILQQSTSSIGIVKTTDEDTEPPELPVEVKEGGMNTGGIDLGSTPTSKTTNVFEESEPFPDWHQTVVEDYCYGG